MNGGGGGRGRKGMEEEANGWMNGGGSGRKGTEEEEGMMRNMVVRDDTGSMCEQCRAEENAEREETKRVRDGWKGRRGGKKKKRGEERESVSE